MRDNQHIEAMYYLSPLQQGLLFHRLADPAGDPYFYQYAYRLQGNLRLDAFERAWQSVVERHAVLRTAFVWEGVEKPLQVVRRQVVLPIERQDWRGVPEDEQRLRFTSLLQQDRAAGIDLLKPPLMRLHVVRRSEQEWVLVNSHHHMLLDGWSMAIVLRDVLTAYETFLLGQAPALKPPRPYRDYIAWVNRQDMKQAEAYWREGLAGFERPTPVPIGAPSEYTSAETLPFAEQFLRLPADKVNSLQVFAKQTKVTVNTILQGAWALLLYRYSGARDLVFGATVSGRTPELTGVDEMVGLFINSLPIRVTVRPEQKLTDFLRSLQEHNATLRQFEWTPLSDIQRWSDVPNGTPLFESLMVFESYPEAEDGGTAPTLAVEPLAAASSGAYTLTQGRNNYPISLMVEPGRDLKVIVCYANNRFAHAAITRMIRHLEQLLAVMVEAPDALLGNLALTTEGEQRQLAEWNESCSSGEPEPTCIHDLIAHQTEEHPETLAVVTKTERVTYREPDRRADQLSRYLRAQGLWSDDRVGLCLDRSLDLVVGILAVLKAGGAYVPLDPTYPQERLTAMIADSDARLILTRSDQSQRLDGCPARLVLLDRQAEEIAACGESAHALPVSPHNLAYVIYTSGSTGRPKGVAVEHRQVTAYVNAILQLEPVAAGTTMAAVSTVAADLGNTALFGTLCSGRTLHLLPTEDSFDPDAMATAMHDRKIEVLKIVPSHLRGLLDAAHPERVLPSRCVILGGEALRGDLVRHIRRLAPGCTIVNHYGPTETTIGVLAHVVEESLDQPATDVPIGRPFSSVQAHILDGVGLPAPVGVPGELYIGGAQVTRGYLNRPEATAERFIPDAFSRRPGARLYRTGDRATRRTDGTIEFLGRVDHQVKIRGFRIELGDIEAQLRRETGVSDAVAVVRGQPDGAQQLVAYLVGPSSLDTEAIRTRLAHRLPDYMVPQIFVRLDAFPLTANGKLDRSGLPDPGLQNTSASTPYVAPRSRTEEILAGIWQTVLQVERVGVHDNFFALGGDSIRTLQVIARANREGVKLTPKQLFEHQTIASAAAVAQVKQNVRSEIQPIVMQKAAVAEPFSLAGLDSGQLQSLFAKYVEEIEDIYPSSPMQQGMLFHSLHGGQDGLYHNHVVYAFTQELDSDAFEQAWQQAIARHAVLRTGFLSEVTSTALQVVFRHVRLPVERLDWRNLVDDTVRRKALQDYLAADRARGFQFDRPPLMRLALIRRGEHSWWMVWSLHHAILDGTSQGLLVQEVMTTYERLRRGEVSVPKPAPSYRDYIQWFLRQDIAGTETFWRDYLHGFGEPSRLPERTDQSVPERVGFGEQRLDVSPQTLRALRRLAQSQRVTLNTVVQAVWALLLSRYSGENDVLFGVTVSGRPEELPAGDAMLGLFINTVPLRVQIAPTTPLAEWLREIQMRNIDLRRYEYSPLVQIQGWSEIGRGTSLFDSVLVFQNYLLDEAIHEYGKTFGVEAVDVEGWTNYPLTITVVPEDRLTLIFSYDKHRVSDEMVGQIVRHWAAMIDGMIEGADARLSELTALSEEERQHLLVDWNDSERTFPSDQCLHELFEAQACRTPDRIAVSFEDLALTYRELDARANQLAHALLRRGVGPAVPVGICVERSAGMLIAMLGVLKAGAAYVPLDPTYPKDRLTYMLQDARVAVMVTQRRLMEELGETSLHRIDIDDWTPIAHESTARPRVSHMSEHLAYVIYTSGSTGRPKGVMVRHRSAVNFLLAMQAALQPTDHEIMAATTSMSFDIALLELFLPLIVGGQTVVISRDVIVDGERLARKLEQVGATIMQATPSGWRLLLDAAWFPRLRVLCGGEACPPELAQAFRARECEMWNLYGPTETTVWSMLTLVGCVDGIVPLGYPLANTQIYVLDANVTLVPIGVPGELYIGGEGLARGYWQRPDLTAERFVPDPFSRLPGARLYRTGDQVRYRRDGTLEFLGRIDHQVKVRGYRIELGEIETCLSRHPKIVRSIVMVRNEQGGQRIVAYLISEGRSSISPDELKQFLQEQLPDYMIPTAFVLLDRFPLTPNGKVDRKALPSPEYSRSNTRKAGPRTPTEEIIAGLWADVLVMPHVGPLDNFFELGGHSLLATQVLSRVRTTFRVELPLRTLFDHPTVEGFAVAIDRALGQVEGLQHTPLVPASRNGRVPLSFAQQRLWFLWQMAPDSPMYNISTALRIIGSLNTTALQDSFHELARRHEILRTTFVVSAGQPRQVIAPEPTHSLSISDLRDLPHDTREAMVRTFVSEETQQPFDLSTGPLLRVRVLQVGDQEWVLLITMHHIVSDGWSMGILVAEMTELYAASVIGQPSPLPPLTIQYADYAVWQRDWMEGEVMERQLAYWKQQLRDAPVLTLPGDRPRPAVQTYRGASHVVTWSSTVTGQLKALSNRRGVTLFMTLLTALNVLLKHETGKQDIVVGTDVTNRSRVEIEKLIGFFINQLVLRTDVSQTFTFHDLLDRVRDTTLAAHARQDVPFDMLVATLMTKRDPRYAPLFQIKLLLQNASPPVEFSGLTMQVIDHEKTTAELDILLNFEETADGLIGGFEYNTDIFDAASIARFAGHLTAIVEQIGACSDVTVEQLERLLTERDSLQRHRKRQELSDVNYRKLKSVKRRMVGPSISTSEDHR